MVAGEVGAAGAAGAAGLLNNGSFWGRIYVCLGRSYGNMRVYVCFLLIPETWEGRRGGVLVCTFPYSGK